MHIFQIFNNIIFSTPEGIIIYTSMLICTSLHPCQNLVPLFLFFNLENLMAQNAFVNISMNTDGAKVFSYL